MSFIAVAGLVVAAAGTAYSIYQQQQAIDAASSASPRPFVPIDIPRTAALAKAADIQGFNMSDEDFRRRFPKLVQGRDFNVANASNQLAGGTSPAVDNALGQSGLRADLGTDEFQKAQNLGKPILAMEQRDRGYFQRLLAENPQRQAGLSGKDVTKLAAQNTAAQGAYNSQIFGNKIDQYNTAIAQGIQNQQAVTTGLAGLAQLYEDSRKPKQSDYLSPSNYPGGNSPAAGGI